MDVLCISIVNLNILLPGVDKSLFDKDLTRLGDYGVVVGGDGVNQAVVMAALGLNAGVAGKIGRDDFGGVAVSALRRRNVDTSNIREIDYRKTAICAVMVSESDHVFAAHRGASEEYSPADVDFEMLKGLRVLNIGSLYSFPALCGDSLGNILSHARSQGIITSADCMSDSYGLGPHAMDAALKELDYFFPNYGEASYITEKTEPEDMAEELHKRGVKNIAIKMGGQGALVSDGKNKLLVPAYYVHPVDTTGAGDSFVAGFLYGVLNGFGLLSCARLASAASSICVGSVGATGHIESARQLLKVIEERGDHV